MQIAKMMRKMLTPAVLIIINGRRQNRAVRKATDAVMTTFMNPAPKIAILFRKKTMIEFNSFKKNLNPFITLPVACLIRPTEKCQLNSKEPVCCKTNTF